MPITYTLDREHRRIFTRAQGLVTLAELQAHVDSEEADGAQGFTELFDARGATTNLRSDEIQVLVQRTERRARRGEIGPTAVVADTDVVYGMARMYAILCESFRLRVEVFREMEPALAWLEHAHGAAPAR